MTDHARNQRRYGKADDELVGYFSAAIGVRAQSYEPSTAAFDPGRPHEARLKALAGGGMRWFDAVGGTLALLDVDYRRVLSAVYRPHAWPTWLADALSTPWGGGTFVALVGTLPRAALAAQSRDVGVTVLDWLAKRGKTAKDALLTSLREDGEALRMPALVAYDALRIARIKAAQVAERAAGERQSERNLQLYSELVGRRAKRQRERFEARLRRGAA